MTMSGPVPGKGVLSHLSTAGLLTIFAAVVLSVPASAASPDEGDRRSSLVASPEKIELGTILCGEVVMRRITLRNGSNRAFSLGAIRFTCGCAIPLITLPNGKTRTPRRGDKPPICTMKPGESVTVELEFQAHVPSGIVTHQIYFSAMDPAEPTLALPITADVRPAFILEPRRFDLGRVSCRKQHESRLIIRSTGAGPFRITGISGLPPFLSCRYREMKEAAAPTWQLDLTVARNAPDGRHSCFLIVALENEKIRSLKIPISLKVEPEITFITAGGGESINFGVLRDGEEAYGEVDIFNLDPEVPYEIEDVNLESADREFLDARLHVLEAGKRYKITLRVKPGIRKRFFRGRIVILSSHADLKRKEIPFKGWISLSDDGKKESP